MGKSSRVRNGKLYQVLCSFFNRLQNKLLNVEEFMNLTEAQWVAKRHKEEYNEERPHSYLDYWTPSEFAVGPRFHSGFCRGCVGSVNPCSLN
jgi:hypothetical protein